MTLKFSAKSADRGRNICNSGRVLLAILTFVMMLGQPLRAHELRPALAEFSADEATRQLTIEFTMNLEAAIARIGPEHEDTSEAETADEYDQLRSLPPAELQLELDEFSDSFVDMIDLSLGNQSVTPNISSAEIPAVGDLELARDSLVTMVVEIPADAENLVFSWDESLGSIVFRTSSENPDGYSAFLTGGQATDTIALFDGKAQAWHEVFLNYIVVGFEHIVPLGIDHILFVIGLFLLSTSFRPLLIQVTSFTLAHTVTLALGLFGLVNISGAIVEPLIAASIVYVAVENILFDKLSRWRPVVVFAFGLLHGLGFASVLTEFGLPKGQYVPGLIGFNIGVELGQLAVIAVCFVLVGIWFGKRDWYRKAVVIPGSLAIGLIGAYWFIERTFLG